MINRQRGDRCLPGVNVSDREDDWTLNFRVPDVVVVLRNGRGVDRGTHWVGGPDLIVEIISPDKEPHAKLDFKESIGVREVLVLQRDPWLLERFSLRDGKLACVVKCSPGEGSVACDVVPVTFAMPQAGRLSAQAAGPAWTI